MDELHDAISYAGLALAGLGMAAVQVVFDLLVDTPDAELDRDVRRWAAVLFALILILEFAVPPLAGQKDELRFLTTAAGFSACAFGPASVRLLRRSRPFSLSDAGE